MSPYGTNYRDLSEFRRRLLLVVVVVVYIDSHKTIGRAVSAALVLVFHNTSSPMSPI